jgi:ABC-type multidrug transport system permease subunit
MSYSLFLLLKGEFRNTFPRFYSLLSFIFTSLVILFGYYCTSKALTPVSSLEGWHQTNYFDYIVFGEIVITLPLAALVSATSAIKNMSQQGILENVIYNSKSPLHSLLTISYSLLLRDSVYVLLHTLIAYTVFHFHIDLLTMLETLLFVLLSLPAFLLLGLFVGQVVLSTGRGSGVLSNVTYLVMLLSGVFFPIDVLPVFLKKISFWLLPQTYLLDSVRKFAADQNFNFCYFVIYFAVWTIFLYLINASTIRYSIKRYPFIKDHLENAR